MKFSENEVLAREERLILRRYKFRTRLRLDFLYLFMFVMMGLVIASISYAGGVVQNIIQSAPQTTSRDILHGGRTTVLYDQDGNEVKRLDAKDTAKKYVALKDISSAAQNAFVAADDTGFYKHQGINLKGLLVTLYGEETSASYADINRTLTQKLIRNQIFMNEDQSSVKGRLVRNIQEQYLAAQMESAVGKEKILEYYLNTLYFGENHIGIGSASEHFFGKTPEELTISEASVLAAAAQDPDLYDPLSDQSANSRKRGEILGKMLEMETITEDEYEDALGDNVYLSVRTVQDEAKNTVAAKSDYASAAVAQVISDLKEKSGYSATQAYNSVYQGGVKIHTCLDSMIQDVCEEEIFKQFQNRKSAKKEQVSFVLLDHSTGMVKALIGLSGKGTYSDQNIATGLLREPGEVLPVLSVWLPAVDTGGKTLGSVEDDSIYNYGTKNGGQEITNPAAEYQGFVAMRDSVIKHLDSTAVKTLQEINPQTGYDYLKKMGITTLVDGQKDLDGNLLTDADLPLACGDLVQGVTNLELTSAYAVLANGGKRMSTRFYTKVLDSTGNVLLQSETEESQILKKSSAWLMTDVLEEYVKKGEGGRINSDEAVILAAGMGGGSRLASDAWFEGYTPDYTAGLWCGSIGTSGPVEEVSSQEIWTRIMQRVYGVRKTSHEAVEKPDNIISCNICTKCGKLAVDELCNEALGGSTVRQEYFVSGTQPVESCSCHVKYRVCRSSGKPAAENCPRSQVEERVYLIKKEKAETGDTKYIVPEDFARTVCDKHRSSGSGQ